VPIPKSRVRPFPHDRSKLYDLGVILVERFCPANKIVSPNVYPVPEPRWHFGACAFYRPDTEAERAHFAEHLAKDGYGPGTNICIDLCGRPAPHETCRNWSWPGSDTDRTPYGVLAHELGHHADYLVGGVKGRYWSEYSSEVRAAANERGLTSYAGENPAEWFAEAFRLFVTNPPLLEALRPRTYHEIGKRFTPVCPTSGDWVQNLGANVPDRIVTNLRKKVVR